MRYDVCIIGGGAAGLAAAASLSKNLKICILEKNEILGRKVLATGGGRCNMTNTACGNCDVSLGFFASLGIETCSDEEGRVYPYSGRASDVVKALTDEIMSGGNADVKTSSSVTEIVKVTGEDGKDFFRVSGITADRVILATGGKAGPQFGTTGDGYAIAKAFGHSVTTVFPILTGVSCEAAGVDFANLKGIRARGTVTLKKDGNPVASETGEIQFTADGLSGICVFNLTPYIKAEPGEKFADALSGFTLCVDLAPDFDEGRIAGRKSAFGIVTEKLAEVIDPGSIKCWELKITGVKGWRDAQCTYGGVALDDVNMETMESEIVKGLYFAGEILDVQGPCGGYNLQNAWETGIKAAKAINGITSE